MTQPPKVFELPHALYPFRLVALGDFHYGGYRLESAFELEPGKMPAAAAQPSAWQAVDFVQSIGSRGNQSMPNLPPTFLTALACLLAAGLARGESAPNTLSEAERRAGWRLLFDGRDASGFRGYRCEALGDGWQVREGALVRAADGASLDTPLS